MENTLPTRISTFDESCELKRNTANKWVNRIIIFAILLIYTIFLLLPFYVIFITSLKSYEEVYSSLNFTWFPQEITFEAYSDILVNDPLAFNIGMPSLISGFLNTLWSTLIPTIVSLFISGLAAFAYAKLNFKGKNGLFLFELATMMIPAGTMVIPSFIFYDALGWANRTDFGAYLPLIIPGLFGGAATIFFLRSYMASIPNDCVEAAKIDGLNTFSIYTRIILPQCIPAFIAQFIFAFVGGYNSYMGPLMYLYGDEKLYTLQVSLGELQNMFGDANQLCAGTLIAMLPLIILYIVFQRFFIEGISIGGGKE